MSSICPRRRKVTVTSKRTTQLNLRKESTYDSNNLLIETKINDLSAVNPTYLNRNIFNYDQKNRLSSVSSLIQNNFEEITNDYLNNYELISSSTSPSGIETEFTYSQQLKHNTRISINDSYNEMTVSNGEISGYSTFFTNYTFTVNEYGYYSVFYNQGVLCQTSILSLGSESDLIGYLSNVNGATYAKSFNSYGKINLACYKPANDTSFTQKTKFLYFEKKTNSINSATNQTGTVRSNWKLYKIIDDYSLRNTYLDYDDEKLIEYKVTNDSNNQLFNLNYSYDNFDRLSTKTLVFDNTNSIDEEYSYQHSFSSVVEDITITVSGLLTVGNILHELSSRNNFNQIDSILFFNNVSKSNKTRFKTQYFYNSKSITENNVSTTYKNDLVKRMDYYITSAVPVQNNPVYSFSDHITYNADGNINRVAHGNQNTPILTTGVTFQYDDYGRIVLETNYDLSRIISYSYDSNGNITSVNERDLNNNLISLTNYTYNSIEPDKLTKFGTKTISYDQDFNIVSIGNNVTYNWTRGRLLQSAILGSKVNNFAYNYEGIRTKKLDSNLVLHTYFLEGHRIIGEKLTSSGDSSYIAYLYGQNGIYGMIYNNNLYYYQKNIFGDIVRIYRGVTLVARYIYDAFGNHIIVDSNGVEITDASNIGHINPFRYRGYYFDEDVNLYYCNTRYYNPTLRRWISIDRNQYIDFENIGGLNLYSYCRNNPVMYKDEEGKEIISLGLFIGLVISSFIIGFSASVISQDRTYGTDKINYFQAFIDGVFAYQD